MAAINRALRFTRKDIELDNRIDHFSGFKGVTVPYVYRGMPPAFMRTWYSFHGEESAMTTCDADNVSGRTALPGTDAALVAPHILIAGDHAALQELLCSALQLAGYRTTACAGRQATLAWIDRATPPGEVEVLIHDYGRLVFQVIYGLTGDWQESQDLTQDTFGKKGLRLNGELSCLFGRFLPCLCLTNEVVQRERHIAQDTEQ